MNVSAVSELRITDFTSIAANTARFSQTANPGFIIGSGLRKECVDFLVPGAFKHSVPERLDMFEKLRDEVPRGEVKFSREAADLVWFVAVYLESHLGVSLNSIIGPNARTFHDFQASLSDIKLDTAGFEAAKQTFVSLIDKLSTAYIASDDMSFLERLELGKHVAPDVRQLLELMTILSENSCRLYSKEIFDLNQELVVSLWSNQERSAEGYNFHVVEPDESHVSTYGSASVCKGGSKKIKRTFVLGKNAENVLTLSVVDTNAAVESEPIQLPRLYK